MKNVHPDFRRAVRLLEGGQTREALGLSDALIASDCERTRLDGYMCRGMVFEDGGDGIDIDLEKSLESYRRASLIAPGAITFLSMARVSIGLGDFAGAYKFLQLSESYEVSPELLLGFAYYFEQVSPVNTEKAMDFYFRAAMKGRFAGFFGYSRVARTSGKNSKALLMDCLRLLTGPFIALAIGKRARYQF